MKYYSKRELYALGETLGDSVTEHKAGGRIYGGGGKGGGGSAPQQQAVAQTSIPEYAKPYVENMLGKTEALTDINQNPYQNYEGQRIAGFSPVQEQAFGNMTNMQTAPQIGQGSGLAAASGMGSMGTARQMGQVGRQYANQATDPYAQQAYMSPYIQNALQPQLQEMQRQYTMTGQQQRKAATSAGAFGGTRDALMQAENERNKNIAMNAAIGSGYQNAFQAAQQNQQFGANLGLQGLQGQLQGLGQANQAAGTLGQLGQTQYGQEMGINQAQQQVGAIQQAQAQQGLDTAYQDFLKQKNYPYQQLAFMSDMTRGLPLSQQSQSIYSAPPSAGSQLGGLGMSALGIYGMSGGFKSAKGGMVGKGYAEGGQVGYAGGGDVSMMSMEQLTQMLDNPNLSPMEVAQIEKQIMLLQRIQSNPESGRVMAGLGAIPTGDMVPEEEGLAGGGIIALASGGDGKQRKEYQTWLEDQTKKQILEQMNAKPFAKSEAQMGELAAEIKASREQAPWMALANAGFGTMAGSSPYALTNLGLGATEGLKSYSKSMDTESLNKKLMLQQQVEAEKAEQARKTGLTGSMQTSLGQLYGREATAESAAASRALTAASKSNSDLIKAQGVYKDLFNNTYDELSKSAKPGGINYKKYKDNPEQLKLDSRAIALNEMAPDLKAVLGFQTAKIPTDGADAPAAAAKPGTAPKAAISVAPPAAISELKKNDSPQTRAQFDAIFGKGAAQKALGT